MTSLSINQITPLLIPEVQSHFFIPNLCSYPTFKAALFYYFPKTLVCSCSFLLIIYYCFKLLETDFFKMLAKTGLLIVSNPKHIGKLLIDVQKTVKSTLYIQLLSALTEPLSFHSNVFNTPPKLSRTIFCIYSQATKHCNNLDVKVLLSNLTRPVPRIQTQNPIDVIIFDKKYSQNEIDNFIKSTVSNVCSKPDILTLDCGSDEPLSVENDIRDTNVYKHVCMGGTFDRLHVAHKVLLTDAVLRASEKVTVGVTEENMTHSKLLWELIEDVDTRINNVKSFVNDVCPELEYNICKISDPYGPSIVDPTMDVLVVSEETIKGGEKINQIRKEKHLKELILVPIQLIEETDPQPKEEPKVSSSTRRLRLLGTLLKPVEKKNIPDKPYVIGLTGGIASGKSGVAEHLENLGCLVINCDKLAHKLYEKGQVCYQRLIDDFGREILSPECEIDRKVLGGIVFKNPKKLQRLNEILWPCMAEEVKSIIGNSEKNIVCVDAAILCQAGWNKFCHEVWVTIIPKEEAKQRLIQRNNLTEEQAQNRISSQPSNKEYVENANVVLSPFWEVEYTRWQVHKAWNLLEKRLL